MGKIDFAFGSTRYTEENLTNFLERINSFIKGKRVGVRGSVYVGGKKKEKRTIFFNSFEIHKSNGKKNRYISSVYDSKKGDTVLEMVDNSSGQLYQLVDLNHLISIETPKEGKMVFTLAFDEKKQDKTSYILDFKQNLCFDFTNKRLAFDDALMILKTLNALIVDKRRGMELCFAETMNREEPSHTFYFNEFKLERSINKSTIYRYNGDFHEDPFNGDFYYFETFLNGDLNGTFFSSDGLLLLEIDDEKGMIHEKSKNPTYKIFANLDTQVWETFWRYRQK